VAGGRSRRCDPAIPELARERVDVRGGEAVQMTEQRRVDLDDGRIGATAGGQAPDLVVLENRVAVLEREYLVVAAELSAFHPLALPGPWS
jgi:hypothetical protein